MPLIRPEDNPRHNGQFLCNLLYTLMLESCEQYVPHFLKHAIYKYDMFFSRISLLQHPNMCCDNIYELSSSVDPHMSPHILALSTLIY